MQTFHFILELPSSAQAPTRGAKSAATWQPSCQKAFEESGSGRKFLDPSPAFSCYQMILQNGHVSYPYFHNIPKRQENKV